MQGTGDTISSVTRTGNRATLSLHIDGPYFPLQKFRQALDNFIDLLAAIDTETSMDGKQTIEWSVESLHSASIHITAVAAPIREDVPANRPREVVNTLTQGIEQLQESPTLPVGFSSQALRCAREVSKLIDPDSFASIRISSDEWSKAIAPRLAGNIDDLEKTTYSIYGSIEGTLVSISLAKKAQLGIQSVIENGIVRAYFDEEDLLEEAKQALGKRVRVFGLVRQRRHGPKLNITAQQLKVLPSREELPTASELLQRLRNGV